MSFNTKIIGVYSFFLLVLSMPIAAQNPKFKVTLDAGHGAHDYGAVYSGRIEKNIALAVVLKVGKILERTNKIDIVYIALPNSLHTEWIKKSASSKKIS
jgi:N-acetylmuramoyl-L-alanine amidase